MKRDILFAMVRRRVWTLLNGYLDSVEELREESKLDEIIVRSSWEEVGSGLVGAFALALDAYEKVGVEEEDERGGTGVRTALDSDDGDKKKAITKKSEQHVFTSGVLTGIGLSFGCALIMSLFWAIAPKMRR